MQSTGMTVMQDAKAQVSRMVGLARVAQKAVSEYTQEQADLLALAAAWALMEPSHNRELSELAVKETGLGNVEDKIQKNHRKTLGLLGDLRNARTVGIVSKDSTAGITEIARPAGVVAAIVPSTNPAATPTNNIVNALKCLNAVIVAPSPRGWAVASRLIAYVHENLDAIGAPRDLVQLLSHPVSKEATRELMAQADLIVATGSQSNIRAAYSSGKPALGVGMGNVSVIIDPSADLNLAAEMIAASKIFDNATSCSAENSVVLPLSRYEEAVRALEKAGGVLLNTDEKQRLSDALWLNHKLNPDMIAKSAPHIASLAGLTSSALQKAKFIMVEEVGWGPDYPFSGEKLSPILTLYRAENLPDACKIVEGIYAWQGAGHSVGLHTNDFSQAEYLGLRLPVTRVIVNQPHCLATGGNFDNRLPFSLSMGCGTWGGNSTSDNLNWKHYLNTTRVVCPVEKRVPDESALFAPYFSALQ